MKESSLLFLSVAFFLILPLSSQALGQMTQPIKIDNALRGEKINQELIAVNTEDRQITVKFTAEGQIKDWVAFYKPNDLKNSVATTTMAARANLSMIAVFSVPEDMPNGEYVGVVSVTKASDKIEQEESYTSIAQKIDREVTIRVSDQEVINLDVSVIPKTYDLQTNESLSVRIIYDNQSNVNLKPLIDFKIKNGEKTVYNVIYPYPEGEPAVNSKAIFEIPALEIPTINMANGKYLAQLEFKRGDKVIAEKQFGFSIGLQNSVLGAKIIKGNLMWPLIILAIILLAVIGFLVKRNLGLRNFNKSL